MDVKPVFDDITIAKIKYVNCLVIIVLKNIYVPFLKAKATTRH